MTASTDAQRGAFKDAAREQWDRCASGWDAHTPQLRDWLRSVTEAMLRMAGITRGASVLDVAAGAGDQTLAIAERVGPEGFVLATDLSPVILERARARAEHAGHRNVQTQVADAERLPLEAVHFDAAVCRLGLMLCPDPLQALREMHRVVRPGGGVCTVVFSRPERNPCIMLLMSTALRHAGLAPRDPYQPGSLLSLGKSGLIDELLVRAGFRDVATTAIDAPFHLPAARDYLEFVRSSASPVQQILGRLEPAAAAAAWDEIEQRLEAYTAPTGWAGPNELLLTAARR
jgi:ubiquinone/menaquinone biosynthesis C-methylase UbiE